MITLKNVTKTYKIKGKKTVVFHNVNLTIPSKARVAFLGPNGVGKSTLLRMISGVESPTAGKIIRKGTLSWRVGLTTGFIPTLSAVENIRFICNLYSCGVDESFEKIQFVKEFADIGVYFKYPMSVYSSGMKARVAFGLSMAFDFDYYIVDETLAVGDSEFKEKCKALLEERIKDRGIIFVSHSMIDVKKICNEGFFLAPGKITYSDDIDKLIGIYKSNTKNQKLS